MVGIQVPLGGHLEVLVLEILAVGVALQILLVMEEAVLQTRQDASAGRIPQVGAGVFHIDAVDAVEIQLEAEALLEVPEGGVQVVADVAASVADVEGADRQHHGPFAAVGAHAGTHRCGFDREIHPHPCSFPYLEVAWLEGLAGTHQGPTAEEGLQIRPELGEHRQRDQ